MSGAFVSYAQQVGERVGEEIFLCGVTDRGRDSDLVGKTFTANVSNEPLTHYAIGNECKV